VEMIFNIYRYSEEKKKVMLVVVEFTDYVMVWWERLVVERRRNRERLVSTWELKTKMKKRYVHKHYYRELFNHLQMIIQCNKSVEEYQKELKVAIVTRPPCGVCW
jgi:hypothetical protein